MFESTLTLNTSGLCRGEATYGQRRYSSTHTFTQYAMST